jgi:hypothetical protein
VAQQPDQAKLLDEIVKGPCFEAGDLPKVPDDARKAPTAKAGLFEDTPE